VRPFIRVSRFAYRICVVSAGVLSFTGLVTQAHSQTAPQLLPYTAKLLAGGGTAVAANAACSRVGAIPSGHFAYDAADDGCLATEIVLSAPRSAILDSGGAVIFADNKNNTIRRIDPTTGIVATIAGGGAAAPKKGLVCSSTDANIASDAVGDGCLATSVILLSAVHLTLAPNGDILVGDSFNYYVRRVSSTLGGVAAVAISNNGAGYATAPTVTFSAPSAGGTTATGTADHQFGLRLHLCSDGDILHTRYRHLTRHGHGCFRWRHLHCNRRLRRFGCQPAWVHRRGCGLLPELDLDHNRLPHRFSLRVYVRSRR
jgi:hypothetical protein